MITKHTKGIERRAIRIRKKIIGVSSRPRVTVYRSNKSLYAQLTDNKTNKTVFGVSEKELKKGEKQAKTGRAKLLGIIMAEKLQKLKNTTIVFDKGGYKYHGRIKAFADAMRENNIKF